MATILYTVPIEATSLSLTVKAVGVKVGYNNSAVMSKTFTLAQVPNVTFTPNPTTPFPGVINLTVAGTGADTIYYTVNGSTPTSGSLVYNPSTGITISANTTVKAFGVKTNYADGAVTTVSYTQATVPTPTFTQAFSGNGETYALYPTTVTIQDSLAGVTFYYTTDGTTPTTGSTLYTGPFLNSNHTTVKALAVKTGYINSAVGTQIYSRAIGRTWTQRSVSQHWTGLASSSDGAKMVAVALGGLIYTSTDSGVTWTSRDSTRQWTAVCSSADGTKLVATVAHVGVIYLSTDSGVTWTPSTVIGAPIEWCSVACTSNGTTIFASSIGGYTVVSTNSGASWSQVSGITSGSRNYVAMSDDGAVRLVISESSNVHYSTDSGATWTATFVYNSTNHFWLKVAVSHDGTKLVVDDGRTWISSDAGVTWTVLIGGTFHASGDTPLVSNDGNVAVIASGYYGSYSNPNDFIYVTHDGGVTVIRRDSARLWGGLAAANDFSVLVASDQGGYLYTSTN